MVGNCTKEKNIDFDELFCLKGWVEYLEFLGPRIIGNKHTKLK